MRWLNPRNYFSPNIIEWLANRAVNETYRGKSNVREHAAIVIRTSAKIAK